MGGWPDPFSWGGRHIHFRHNTVNPDDLEDAFFWREEYKATVGEVEQ